MIFLFPIWGFLSSSRSFSGVASMTWDLGILKPRGLCWFPIVARYIFQDAIPRGAARNCQLLDMLYILSVSRAIVGMEFNCIPWKAKNVEKWKTGKLREVLAPFFLPIYVTCLHQVMTILCWVPYLTVWRMVIFEFRESVFILRKSWAWWKPNNVARICCFQLRGLQQFILWQVLFFAADFWEGSGGGPKMFLGDLVEFWFMSCIHVWSSS